MKTYYKIENTLGGYTITTINYEDERKTFPVDVFPTFEGAEKHLEEMGYISEIKRSYKNFKE